MSAPPAEGARIAWRDVPQDVRGAIERVCGAPVVAAWTQPGGFSPGVAARVRCADGTGWFVKAASAELNPDAPRLHRQEASVLAGLDQLIAAGQLPVPRLRGTAELGPWFALVVDDVAGRQPALPWQDGELDLVLAALDRLADALTPAPVTVPTVAEYLGTDFTGWRTLAGTPDDDRIDPWSRGRLPELAGLEATWAAHAAGGTLLHADVRADNLLLTDEGVMVVDWPHACRGAAFADLVFFAPSVAMQGGPEPAALLARSRAGRAVSREALAAVVCALAGYFTERSLRPAPPGLPTVRRFQAAQAEVTRRWLAMLLGPDALCTTRSGSPRLRYAMDDAAKKTAPTTSPGWDVVDLLGEIAGIGRDSVLGGYSRHLFEPAELALRQWFTRRAEALGLDVELDRNGNIWAYWGARGSGTVALGSHLDSVPGGGAFDGPLGVASALSAVARLREQGVVPARPVAVVAFAEEEGSRFGVACLGSKLMVGAIDPARAVMLTDATGVTFAAAAAAVGLDPGELGRDGERLASLAAFVELHVEQGRGLADMGAPVAVATSILAHGRWRLRFSGEGNHAGATAMRDRRDPVVAAAAAVLAARDIAARHDDPANGMHGRATVGRLIPVPGGTNVIASRVDAWLDVRGDSDASTRALLAEIIDAIRDRAAWYGCQVEDTEESYSGPVAFDADLRTRLAGTLGHPPLLATGAGHDAGVLADILPAAMLFVRNPTGVSHSPLETASDEDCRAGADALTKALSELLGQPTS